jgi:hypothetical protein
MLLIALTGVVAGHTCAYLVTTPVGRDRGALLSAGHGYWEAATALAVVAAAVALAVQVARPVVGQLRPRSLAGLQVVLFTFMESCELLATGQPLDALASHRGFLIGIGLQVVVAVVLTRVFRLAVEAVAAVFGPSRQLPRATARGTRLVIRTLDPRRKPLGRQCGSRAPPLALS